MGYDRGDSFPIDYESNVIPFGSKLKGKLSQRSYPIQCKRKWKHSFLSVLYKCGAQDTANCIGYVSVRSQKSTHFYPNKPMLFFTHVFLAHHLLPKYDARFF